MTNPDDCLKKGLIRRKEDAKLRVSDSIKIAEKFLNSAIKNLEIKEYETCVMVAYNSIFHSCRALLFEKGYTERSHFCLVSMLNFLYKDDKRLIEFLTSIDKIRLSRHEVQYRGEMASKEEADFVLELARDFLDCLKEKLKIKLK